MSIVKLLEKLATVAHHRLNLEELARSQPVEIKNALLKNDSKKLKQQLSSVVWYADKTGVVQL